MMKYIDADKLKAEIERRIAEYDKWIEEHPIQAGGSPIRERREELASLKEDFIDTLSEEPDKSLEEEIREYMSNDDNNPYDWDWRDKRDCARHFAQWGAEHTPLPEDTVIFNKGIEEGKRLMMEEAVEGVVCYGSEGAYIETDFLGTEDTEVYGMPGDKVRVVVLRKEDKK